MAPLGTEEELFDRAAKDPVPILSYPELVRSVAELSVSDPKRREDQILFFRGQEEDFLHDDGASTFYPRIYRPHGVETHEVVHRFLVLGEAEQLLIEAFTNERVRGVEDVKRRQYIRWSILEHYEVCRTPLLDLTHSLRVACSFGQGHRHDSDGFVFVFGLPYPKNHISIDSELDLVNIRLLSICPPEALRPHFQEGYLAGTIDVTADFIPSEQPLLDFRRRLVAKFRISGRNFWGAEFSQVPRDLLFPTDDRVRQIAESIRTGLSDFRLPPDLSYFLENWIRLETKLRNHARGRPRSTADAIEAMEEKGIFTSVEARQLRDLDRFCIRTQRYPFVVDEDRLQERTRELRRALEEIEPRLS